VTAVDGVVVVVVPLPVLVPDGVVVVPLPLLVPGVVLVVLLPATGVVTGTTVHQ
jgi:hypothetical protein